MGPEEAGLRAVFMDASINGVIANRYKKEAHAASELKASKGRKDFQHHPISYYRELIPHAVGMEKFDGLLPFFDVSERAMPYVQVLRPDERLSESDAEFYREVHQLAVAEGVMHDHYKPQPEVEQWIEDEARELIDRVEASGAYDPGDGDRLFRMVLGTGIATRIIFARATNLVRRSTDLATVEYSFVNTAVRDVCRGLLFSVMRNLAFREEFAGNTEEIFYKRFDDFLRMNLRDPTAVNRSLLAQFRENVIFLKNSREDFGPVLLALKATLQLPELAEYLKRSPWHTPDRPRARKEKDLPFGEVTLVKTYGENDEHVVYYTASGAEHETRICHSCTYDDKGGEITLSALLPANAPEYTFSNVFGCYLDDNGKVYLGEADWLAPPSQHERYRVPAHDIAQVDAIFAELLVQEWDRFPGIFADLSHLGPIFIVERAEARHLICPRGSSERVSSELECEPLPAEATIALLKAVAIRGEGRWSGFALGEVDGVEGDFSTGVPESRSGWRARVREQLSQRNSMSYPQFVKLLAQFDVEETSRGKGSHGSLLRRVGDQEYRQGTWTTIREGNSPLEIDFIWECIERLQIGYAPFSEALGGK